MTLEEIITKAEAELAEAAQKQDWSKANELDGYLLGARSNSDMIPTIKVRIDMEAKEGSYGEAAFFTAWLRGREDAEKATE